MLQEKAGMMAGLVWEALSKSELSVKELRKATKAKSEKELFLGLGWLLREDKIVLTGDEKDPTVALK